MNDLVLVEGSKGALKHLTWHLGFKSWSMAVLEVRDLHLTEKLGETPVAVFGFDHHFYDSSKIANYYTFRGFSAVFSCF